MHNGIHVTHISFLTEIQHMCVKITVTVFFVFQVEVAGMPCINELPLQYKNPDDYTAEEIDQLFKVKDNLEVTSITW